MQRGAAAFREVFHPAAIRASLYKSLAVTRRFAGGKPMTCRSVSTAVAATVVLALPGQQVPVRTLSTPDVEYAEPFSQVDGIRELSDGRVIVIDSRERLIHAVDMKAGKAERVAREGAGPGEYRVPLAIYPLPGDSSAVYDMAAEGKLLVITPQGASAGTLPVPDPAPKLTRRGGTDARGRLYVEVAGIRRSATGAPMLTDSMVIERVDRGTGKRDTLARVSRRLVSPLVSRAPRTPSPGGGLVVPAGPRQGALPPFASFDQWAVAPDGRIAVVSVDPYRVSFTDPNGTHTVGPVLEVTRVRVDEKLKEQFRAEARRSVPVLSYSGGQITVSSRPGRFEEPPEWPDGLPAFLPEAVRFAPDGMLWVTRAVAADQPPAIDVIDRSGKIAQRVVLPRNTRLVGFGTNVVYVVRIDQDDLRYLQRHRLPSIR
jgi:hypothetical protein